MQVSDLESLIYKNMRNKTSSLRAVIRHIALRKQLRLTRMENVQKSLAQDEPRDNCAAALTEKGAAADYSAEIYCVEQKFAALTLNEV